MSNRRHLAPLAVLTLLLAAALACGPSLAASTQPPSPEEMTQLALGQTAQAETEQAGEAGPTEVPPTVAPDEPTAPPTATATIAHSTFPTGPTSIDSFMTDRSTRALASERRAIADNFDVLLFERPYTAQTMDYLPHLDITRAELDAAGTWFYVTIFLEEAAPADSTARYGIEIDVDMDGRGDWFIWAQSPPGTEWNADVVQALMDSDNNVGDSFPIQAEAPPQAGNGYDDVRADGGFLPASDPDAVWIRWSPASPSQVQLAFKQSLIGPPGQFLWGAWSDDGPKYPAWYDYNDHFSPAQAGSPVIDSSNYPLNELAQIDNTCRWGYGFIPDGTEPGLCYIPPTPTPTFTPSYTPTPTNTPVIVF